MNSQNQNNYWWITPYGLTIFFLIPIFCVIFIITKDKYIANTYNFLSIKYFVIGLLYLILFAIWSFFGSRLKITQNKTRTLYIKPFFLDFLAVTTICSYFIWFGKLIFNPSLVISIFLGEGGTDGVRHYVSTTPGITTLSQLGIIYTILYLTIFFMNSNGQLSRRYHLYFISILILTLFRVIAWSERLALIEVLVPLILITVSNVNLKKFKLTFLIRYAPYLGILLLLVFFGVTEYFRSWNYYKQYYSNIVEFVLERTLNYYSTSLNNGAGIIEYATGINGYFWYSLNWLYKMPLVGEFLVDILNASSPIGSFLSTYATQEYNNPSGIYIIAYELSFYGGILYVTAFGFVTGILYRSFYEKSGLGVYLYPVFFIGILEFLRLLYLSESRVFPIILFSIIGYLFFTKRKKCT